MNMNFNEKYKNEMKNNKPSPEFIGRLSERLEKEQERVRRKKKAVSSAIAAAACCAVAVTAAMNFLMPATEAKTVSEPDSSSALSSVTVRTNEAGCGPDSVKEIRIKQWHDDSDTPEKCAHKLYERLSDDEQLLRLYASDKDTFGREDIIDNSKAQDICRMFGSAVVSEREFIPEINYMAVFRDGCIAKFSVGKDGTFIIKDVDAVFEF